MTRSVSDRARQLATELQRLFAQDAELAHQPNDAHHLLLDANDRLWTDLHADGLGALHGHPGPESARLQTAACGRSEVLEVPDPRGALQEVRWEIRQAHCDYQQVAKDRRHLAAETGDAIRAFLDQLMTAGWSEQEARDANVHELAGSTGPRWRRLSNDDNKLASGITTCRGSTGRGRTSGPTKGPPRD